MAGTSVEVIDETRVHRGVGPYALRKAGGSRRRELNGASLWRGTGACGHPSRTSGRNLCRCDEQRLLKAGLRGRPSRLAATGPAHVPATHVENACATASAAGAAGGGDRCLLNTSAHRSIDLARKAPRLGGSMTHGQQRDSQIKGKAVR